MIKLSGDGFVFLIAFITSVALLVIMPIYLYFKESIDWDELIFAMIAGIIFSMIFFNAADNRVCGNTSRYAGT